jgi:hypothetical protein
MHIHFERSGGFAGRIITRDINASELPPPEQEQVKTWVNQVNFFQLPKSVPALGQPDGFQYQITVTDGDRKHSVTVHDPAPEAISPLLNWLKTSR